MCTMKTLLIITFVISILAIHIIYILTVTVEMQKDIMANGTEDDTSDFIQANDTMDHKNIYETNDTSKSNIDKKKMNDTIKNKVNDFNSRFPIEGDNTLKWTITYVGTALILTAVLIGICRFSRRFSKHRLMRRWLRDRRVTPESDFQHGEIGQTAGIQRRRRNIQIDEEIDFEGQWIQQQVNVLPPNERAQYYTITRVPENNEYI